MNKRPHIFLQCTSSKHEGPFHSGFRQNDKDPLWTCCSMFVSVEQRFLTYVQKTNKNLSAWCGCTNKILYLFIYSRIKGPQGAYTVKKNNFMIITNN